MQEIKQIRQNYGRAVEKVPRDLNEQGKPINLNEVPINGKYLLFRDMGIGDGLVTEKMAAEMCEGLEKLAQYSDKILMERLRNLHMPQYKTIEDVPYIMIVRASKTLH